MSLATIPTSLWASIYTRSVAAYINRGYALTIARQQAAYDMSQCYIRDDVIDLRDFQKDKDDERAGDWTR